jgi:hypothetical protein
MEDVYMFQKTKDNTPSTSLMNSRSPCEIKSHQHDSPALLNPEPRIRGYSEQLSNPFALTPMEDVKFKKSSDENSTGQLIARRQKLLQLSKAVVMRIRELGLK